MHGNVDKSMEEVSVQLSTKGLETILPNKEVYKCMLSNKIFGFQSTEKMGCKSFVDSLLTDFSMVSSVFPWNYRFPNLCLSTCKLKTQGPELEN